MNNKYLWVILAAGLLSIFLIGGCTTGAIHDRINQRIFIVDPKPFRKLTGIIVPKPYDPADKLCGKNEYYAYIPSRDTHAWVCEESIVFLD